MTKSLSNIPKSSSIFTFCRQTAKIEAKDALNAKFGSATIVRGSSIQSKIDVGKKYKAQLELQNKKGE